MLNLENKNKEKAIQLVAEELRGYKGKKVTLMEVCGTHTMAISKQGIRGLLPENIRIVSGPGCPVCVTSQQYVDSAISIAQSKNAIITTFGDMMRVPGNGTSLLAQKAEGSDIRMVYSPFDALKVAQDNPDKKVVFLSVGFETTTPVIALDVEEARKREIKNFFLLTGNKTIPQALALLANDDEICLDGFIYPGHVSAIIGMSLYHHLAEAFHIGGVVAGFEADELLAGIYTLVRAINEGQVIVENLYKKVVKEEGNPKAVQIVENVFKPCDAEWRGIGMIPDSGLCLRDEYAMFDAEKALGIAIESQEQPISDRGCRCGDILRGRIRPTECPLFGKACNPEHPVGACMVSSEGTCAAYHRYGG